MCDILCIHKKGCMMIRFNDYSFKGVKLIGSCPSRAQNFTEKHNEIVNRAYDLAAKLSQNGTDVFVLEDSSKNYWGAITTDVNTYLLTGKDARVVNSLNETKEKFPKLFGDSYYQNKFDANGIKAQENKINSLQKDLAEFIATKKS